MSRHLSAVFFLKVWEQRDIRNIFIFNLSWLFRFWYDNTWFYCYINHEPWSYRKFKNEIERFCRKRKQVHFHSFCTSCMCWTRRTACQRWTSYISPPDGDEPEHKRLFKIELKNFIKTHNKCLCVLYDRLKCGEHGQYLPTPADPQHISFPGPIRILFDFFHPNQVFFIFATKWTFPYFWKDHVRSIVNGAAILLIEHPCCDMSKHVTQNTTILGNMVTKPSLIPKTIKKSGKPWNFGLICDPL